jgi:predicted house-cleaning noncanonical NTP pyrophosphatase (MazG superfamily)
MIKYYHKLVRDDIPRHLTEEVGIHIDVDKFNNDEIVPALLEKLKEEYAEFIEAIGDKKIEELADIQEVINGLTLESGFTLAEREQAVVILELSEISSQTTLDSSVELFISASSDVEKLEALAIMQQTLYTIILETGYTLAQVDRARNHKLYIRGGFIDRVLLISTEE